MRQLLLTAVCLSFTGCATTTSTEMSTRPACNPRSQCFNQGAVRDFRMRDRDTILVEVGANRCPYVVEVDGSFCDLGFASTIAFQNRNGRICSAGRSYIISGPFTRSRDDVCRVRAVTSYRCRGFTCEAGGTLSGGSRGCGAHRERSYCA